MILYVIAFCASVSAAGAPQDCRLSDTGNYASASECKQALENQGPDYRCYFYDKPGSTLKLSALANKRMSPPTRAPSRAPTVVVKTGNEDPQRWLYVNSFLSVATTMVGVAVQYGRDPWQDADNAGYFSSCVKGDPTSILQCHLTIAQRRSLYGQVVTYYRSLGPHYVLPE